MRNESNGKSRLTNLLINAVAVVGTKSMKTTIREERAKIEKIRAWEQDRCHLIELESKRIMAMLEDPAVPVAEAMNAFRESNEFLNIVCNKSTQDLV